MGRREHDDLSTLESRNPGVMLVRKRRLDAAGENRLIISLWLCRPVMSGLSGLIFVGALGAFFVMGFQYICIDSLIVVAFQDIVLTAYSYKRDPKLRYNMAAVGVWSIMKVYHLSSPHFGDTL